VTVLTANAARRDINKYIAEAAPPAHAAAAAACQAIPWSYEPSTRFDLTLETAKKNSHPWTSYSTSYTLWGLSRRSLAVLRCRLTIAPIISGVGLKFKVRTSGQIRVFDKFEANLLELPSSDSNQIYQLYTGRFPLSMTAKLRESDERISSARGPNSRHSNMHNSKPEVEIEKLSTPFYTSHRAPQNAI